MTTEDARDAILRGAEYGPVCGRLPVAADCAGGAVPCASGCDRCALAAWYAHEPSVPNLAARAGAKMSAPTGDACPRCGGLLVRTGTCMTCSACGESTGGCG